MKLHCHAVLALLAAPAVWPSPAAATSCGVSAQGTSFGSYDSLSPVPLDGVGNVAVTCDSDVSYSISLSEGQGSFDRRVMTAGAAQLGYNLYTDASRRNVWGDGTGGTSTVSAAGTFANLPVYGRIPSRQSVPASAYSDTVVVTVSY
jgi:spore coat protein U-like protein